MFEWDEAKRLANKERHGIDLPQASILFDGRARLTFRSEYAGELRFVTVAEYNSKFYTVVWTWREDVQRLISFRRARDEEKIYYYQTYRY